MPDRQDVLRQVATILLQAPSVGILRVGIDGVDGAGKTTFADELASVLEASGRPVIRASLDGFHHPKASRYRLGRDSPEGFFRDSFNYAELKAVLLEPLGPGGSGSYRTAMFDYRADTPAPSSEQQAVPGSILVFDGIFLHRPELHVYWGFSVFLEVGFDVSISRMAQRDAGSPDPQAAENRRYVEGQKLYLRECNPRCHATLTINNETLALPYIIT